MGAGVRLVTTMAMADRCTMSGVSSMPSIAAVRAVSSVSPGPITVTMAGMPRHVREAAEGHRDETGGTGEKGDAIEIHVIDDTIRPDRGTDVGGEAGALACAKLRPHLHAMSDANRAAGARAPVVQVDYPEWVSELVDYERPYPDDESRMRLAIAVSRANVERGTGGPFGAAIYESGSGKLVAVGMNSVVRLGNCTLHGEMVAFMMAQHVVGSFSLSAPGMPEHELFTSCEPCAMCLGATLWSGVKRVVYGAGREDASRLNFEEGPVFPASYRYLEDRGITIVRDLLRDEARAVLELYRSKNGKIYNG
jgi:tRNA(Arg) A34 adenosine deaminase TadA